MNYSFYYPEWNSRENICKDYPEIKEITREPRFWYGKGPRETYERPKNQSNDY